MKQLRRSVVMIAGVLLACMTVARSNDPPEYFAAKVEGLSLGTWSWAQTSSGLVDVAAGVWKDDAFDVKGPLSPAYAGVRLDGLRVCWRPKSVTDTPAAIELEIGYMKDGKYVQVGVLDRRYVSLAQTKHVYCYEIALPAGFAVEAGPRQQVRIRVKSDFDAQVSVSANGHFFFKSQG